MKHKMMLRLLSITLTVCLLVLAMPVSVVLGATALVSPTTGPPGTAVAVSGISFTGLAQYTVTFGSYGIVGSGQANGIGSIYTTFTVPEILPRGSYTVTVTDTSALSSSTPFVITPKLNLIGAGSGKVGDQVMVTGAGFQAGASVSILFDSIIVTTVVANAFTGVIPQTTFTVPESAAGIIHTIKGNDVYGDSSSVNFTTLSQMTINPATGGVGDTVTVSGNGFAANSLVTFWWDGTVQAGVTDTTNSVGSFTKIFTIPTAGTGAHTITAKDASANESTATFTTGAKIATTPPSGYVGSTVIVSGSGFNASQVVTIYYDSGIVGTAAADTNGSFPNTTFTVPASAKGSHTIKAQDASNNEATATFTVLHKMAITPTSGGVGDTVTVSGSGFAANRTITITFRGNQVVTSPATIPTGLTGSFSATFTVPAGQAGAALVEVSDNTNSAVTNMVITASATISPTTTADSPGYVGMSLTVSGTGFLPNAPVTVTYDTTTLPPATTNANGDFSVAVTIPPSAGGNHVITVSDGTTARQFAFVMESEAPPVPAPLLPEMGVKAEQPVIFDWGDVTDDSGVTYTLWIALNSEFNVLIVPEKTGLTASQYTLTEAEELASVSKNTPYYWRVKATDGAGNESAWSGGGSFYIGSSFGDILDFSSWPDWVVYVLIGVGGVLLVLVGLWLGRRSVSY